jgi:hypothetical protein
MVWVERLIEDDYGLESSWRAHSALEAFYLARFASGRQVEADRLRSGIQVGSMVIILMILPLFTDTIRDKVVGPSNPWEEVEKLRPDGMIDVPLESPHL